ncbi:DNA-binding transcriptional regulator, IclR family [Nakamurella panacisegetis]|uniref:Glycerol operon regulatory protein n=1 Tax=Nakamurella panacisegetis TaxID=1090615 RepID=A0A1H0MYL8_9ACTN|nr:IclR family transcriptional regulator [Nakamurella panacisegetis]SDO85366.1 DNA-binding transcriptional regulator, IclR family [Nakamurella panacisegetis]
MPEPALSRAAHHGEPAEFADRSGRAPDGRAVDSGSGNGSGSVQSVDRALTILKLLAADGELGVTEIAGLLGVHKSTASRLLATLETHGLAEQLPDRGRYRLGVGVLRLAGATRSRLDIVRESRPVTAPLAADIGETVNIVILSGTETLYLDQVAGPSALQIHNWIGHRNPVHATANGRVLLAHASATEAEAILGAALTPSGRLRALTPNTITDRAALQAALALVRRDGYAVAVDELEIGLTAVAAPIRGVDGSVIASLSVSGPSFRLEATRMPRAIKAVRDAAALVSARMGYLAPSGGIRPV